MGSQVWLAAAALLVLFVVSVLSRTAAAESSLGGFGAAQTRRTVHRLQAEARLLWKASRQDGSLSVALRNNADAAALCRAAQLLLLEAGLAMSGDLLDLMAVLQEDRDEIAQGLGASLEA